MPQKRFSHEDFDKMVEETLTKKPVGAQSPPRQLLQKLLAQARKRKV